jgi:hypothetical protein
MQNWVPHKYESGGLPFQQFFLVSDYCSKYPKLVDKTITLFLISHALTSEQSKLHLEEGLGFGAVFEMLFKFSLHCHWSSYI